MDMHRERNESEIAGYWTPERKRAAKPRERIVTAPRPGAVTRSGARPGYDPSATRKPSELGQPHRVAHPTRYPWRTVGKLFFVSGGEDWVGSASAIAADGLMSAAHHLYDANDRRSSQILFLPA